MMNFDARIQLILVSEHSGHSRKRCEIAHILARRMF
jgi:hypothetical protein